MHWTWTRFEGLGVDGLYDALALRCRVFILEQGPYLDPDGLDRSAWHLLGRDQAGTLQAYLRVVDPGCKYAEAFKALDLEALKQDLIAVQTDSQGNWAITVQRLTGADVILVFESISDNIVVASKSITENPKLGGEGPVSSCCIEGCQRSFPIPSSRNRMVND